MAVILLHRPENGVSQTLTWNYLWPPVVTAEQLFKCISIKLAARLT